MKTKNSLSGYRRKDRRAFNLVSYVLLTALTLFCFVPFLLIISGSFTSQNSILVDGYRLFPKEFSLEAYQFLLKAPGDLVRAYGVTIFVTVIGTLASLLVTSMAAYVLSSQVSNTGTPSRSFSISQRCSAEAWSPGIFSISNICISKTATSP